MLSHLCKFRLLISLVCHSCQDETKVTRSLMYLVGIIFYVTYFVFIVAMSVISEDTRKLRNQFNDQSWLVNLKTSQELHGEVSRALCVSLLCLPSVHVCVSLCTSLSLNG